MPSLIHLSRGTLATRSQSRQRPMGSLEQRRVDPPMQRPSAQFMPDHPRNGGSEMFLSCAQIVPRPIDEPKRRSFHEPNVAHLSAHIGPTGLGGADGTVRSRGGTPLPFAGPLPAVHRQRMFPKRLLTGSRLLAMQTHRRCSAEMQQMLPTLRIQGTGNLVSPMMVPQHAMMAQPGVNMVPPPPQPPFMVQPPPTLMSGCPVLLVVPLTRP